MSNATPFLPMGPTFMITLAGTIVNTALTSPSPCSQFRIVNGSGNISVLLTPASAPANVGTPSPTGAPGMLIPANATVVISGPTIGPGNNVQCSANGTSTFYIQGGEGTS